MKDYLQDLIQHTHGLGVIELVKIVGTDKETQITAIAEDKSVIVMGSFKDPISDFIGTFGMPNLSKLKTILSFDDYDEHAVINVVRGNKADPDVPTNIRFQTKNNDFANEYRLMAKAIVEEKIRNPMFKGATWNVEFEPTIAGIMRLKKQASANSEEQHFSTSTVNGDLKISFGDATTHNGNFVFHPEVKGKLTKQWNWPVKVFQSIMDLSGDKKVKISDQGATEITVDSGLATYRYLLPAQAK
jgi:hypothetical protein